MVGKAFESGQVVVNIIACMSSGHACTYVNMLFPSVTAHGSVRGTLSLRPTSSGFYTLLPQLETPESQSNEQESSPLAVIGGAVGAALVTIAVIIIVVTMIACITRKKSENWTTPHMTNGETEMKTYRKHSEVISTDQNEAYGTQGVFSLFQNVAYGETFVDDGEYENYDYVRSQV